MAATDVPAEVQRIDKGFLEQTASLGDQYVSLVTLARLHSRFYDDAKIRALTEERVLTTHAKMPPELRLDVFEKLAASCIAHGDSDNALRVIAEYAALVDGLTWRPQELYPRLAKVAELRIDAGDTERARSEIEAVLARYLEQRDQILNAYRPEALRPLALATHRLGDREQALGLMALAVEEGAENPNARPRCCDLVATCVAMAVHGIEPSAELWQRLRELSAGLREPW
jgi:hypothetical protein